ncbi:MAG TPA: tetratricopeptide repeat protein [Pyrinomonadaceae bacterium]|nr:tetratricopeptide repeat protein [Pyrinomonadaceae bacterium]
MSTRNKLGAAALAAALVLAPFTPDIEATAAAAVRTILQDGDVPSDAEQAMFTKGQNLYNQGRYDQAAAVLKDFLKSYPNSIITDLTLLWLGRSYMQLGKLDDAEQVGQRLRTIKDTPFADIYESELMTARRESPARNPEAGSGASTTVATVTPSPSPVRTPSASSTSRTPAAVRPKTTATTTSTPPVNTARTGTTTTTTTTPPASSQQARQIGGNPTLEITGTTPAPTATASRSNVRPRRQNRRGREQQQQGTTAANTTTTATNNPPRTVAPPRVRPTPTPTPAQVASTATPRNTGRTSTQRATTTTTTERAAVPSSTPSMSPVITTTASPRPIATPTPVPPPSSTETTMATETTTAATTMAPAATQGGSGLSLTVRQVPNLSLALRNSAESASPGQSVQLPLTVTNTGNKVDQFRLDTDLPAEFQPSFSLAQGGTDTGLPTLVTPEIARGASVEVMLNLRVPETAIDGQQRRFFVRAASQSKDQVFRVADGAISIVAAALSAASNVSNASVMPGETFTQIITVRNTGSASARSARADFVFDPNFELVNASPSPIAYDRPSRTAIWSLGDLSARASREISVTLRAVPDALAATSTLGRGMLRTQSLPTPSNFDSPSITIGRVPRAEIGAISVGLTATPGDTIYVPFIVRNPGNSPDAYELRVVAPGAPAGTIYADANGDGQHQEGEPAITQTSPIDPQGGQFPTLLQVRIPGSTADRQQFSYNIVARSLASNRVASEASTVLTVAAPRVRVRTEQVSDANNPGDSIFYRLVLINEGSGLAKSLVVSETLPDALQFVNSDPALSTQDAPGNTQRFTWRVGELAPGDTAVLRVAVRLRPNLPADAVLTTRHTLSYQDTNGNSYQGQ